MPNLPTGTVTFLFTDIEGSTRLWEQNPSGMQRALQLHDLHLRQAIDAHGGHVFKTVGDAFCAVFSHSPDALGAALAIQRAIHAENWTPVGLPTSHAIKVRLALHTGVAEERGGDYFGPDVNRVARLLAAGHGGQVLLSQAAYDLVRHHLIDPIEVRDFGERRLRDLARPEHIWQISAPGLPSQFPPLKTLDLFPNNLPLQLTPFIGRQKELVAVLALLRRNEIRLVTVTGPGGAGKTRLGLQVAAGLLDEFEHGVFFVPLSAVANSELVVPSIAQTLGIKEISGKPLQASLTEYLADKEILLLLDNFEHVLGARTSVSELLAACARLKVLVTSREVTRINGEHQFPVPPMSLPDLDQSADLETIASAEAIELFAQRAKSVRPDFGITHANAPIVVQICSLLDALPLAIELAAARTKILSPQALLARLSSWTSSASGRLDLLASGARDLPARQQALRTAIAWSYDLLKEEEQALQRRASVFVGGCTLEALEAVARNGDPGNLITTPMLDLAASLVDKSLLRIDEPVEEGGSGEPRFRMLWTIREYCEERMAERGELESVRRRHATYFMQIAEAAESHLKSAERAPWLRQLQTEHPNLQAALEWCLGEGGDPEIGLRMVGALHWFWYFRGYFTEGRRYLEALLARAGDLRRTPAGAKALDAAGRLALLQDDYTIMRHRLEESVAVWRQVGDGRGLAYALTDLGIAIVHKDRDPAGRPLLEEGVALFRELEDKWGLAFSLDLLADATILLGDQAQANELYVQSLNLYRDLGDRWGIASELNTLGGSAVLAGDYVTAAAWLSDALDTALEIGDNWLVAHASRTLGDATLCQGDWERAAPLYERSLGLYRHLGDRLRISALLRNLGHIAYHDNDLERASRLYTESLTILQTLDFRPGLIWSVAALAGLFAAQGQFMVAARLLGAATKLGEAVGAALMPVDSLIYKRNLESVRDRLIERDFESAWADGTEMSLEQSVAYALEQLQGRRAIPFEAVL